MVALVRAMRGLEFDFRLIPSSSVTAIYQAILQTECDGYNIG